MGASVIIDGQPLGDTGSPRVEPSTLAYDWDDAGGIVGPQNASFLIVANPRDPLPALQAFTPVQIDDDGERAWSGYVLTAVRNRWGVAVTCQGTKNHLNGDLLTLLSLDTDLSNWTGQTTLQGETLYDTRPNPWTPAGSEAELVSSAAQGITLTWPATQTGFVQNSGQAVVAVMPTWPFGVTGVLVNISLTASIAGRFRIWTTNELTPIFARSDSLDVADTFGMASFTVAVPVARYLKLGWGWSTSSTSASAIATITLIWLSGASPAAFQTADAVAREVVALVPQLNQDLSEIKPTPTLIGQSAWPAPGSTAADILTDLAAYDDPLLGVDQFDRLVFQPRTGVPALELGVDCPPSQEAPSDPSVLVDQVIVSGTDGYGLPYSRRFTELDLPETGLIPAAGVSVPNGDFAAGTAPWACTAGSALVNGGGFLEWRLNNPPTYSPAISPNEYIGVLLTGTFQAGLSYLLEFTIEDPTLYASGKEALSAHVLDAMLFDNADLQGAAETQVRVYATPSTYAISWTPRRTTSSAAFYLFNSQARPQSYSDGRTAYYCLGPNLSNVALYQAAREGPLTRRGVTRTGMVTAPLVVNDQIATALAVAYLRGSLRQGLTGVRTAADGKARDATSHAPLSAAAVLASVGQLGRLSDRIDPDAGIIGPSAYLSQVAFDRRSRTCTITVGQRYGAFDQLMAQLAGSEGSSRTGSQRWKPFSYSRLLG